MAAPKFYSITAIPAAGSRDSNGIYFLRTPSGYTLHRVDETVNKNIVDLKIDWSNVENKPAATSSTSGYLSSTDWNNFESASRYRGVIPTAADLNTYINTGSWTAVSSTPATLINCPTSTVNSITLEVTNGAYIVQKLIVTSTNEIYVRTRNSFSTWTAWQKVAFQSWVTSNFAPITGGNYVNKAGDDMSGRLKMQSVPIVSNFQSTYTAGSNGYLQKIYAPLIDNFYSGTNTGALCIKHVAHSNATMFKVGFKIWGYSGAYVGEGTIQFYQLNNTTVPINSRSGYYTISNNFPSTQTRVGFDGSGDLSIIIGDVGTNWGSYLRVEITDIVTSHQGGQQSAWENGWSTSIETDLSAYTSVQTIPVTVSQSALNGTGLVKSTAGTISYITDNSSNWNAAYSWGNHATAGYLTSYTETDPTVPNYAKTLTSFSIIKPSTDALYEPLFSKNTAFNKNFGTASGTVAEGNDSRINNGQTAYSWGNHSGLYLSLSSGGTVASNTGIGLAASVNQALGIRALAGNRRGLVVQGTSGQSANLQEWQNNGGTPLAYVDASGQIVFSAPTYSTGGNDILVKNQSTGLTEKISAATLLGSSTILNQNVSAQSAAFWINGSGTMAHLYLPQSGTIRMNDQTGVFDNIIEVPTGTGNFKFTSERVAKSFTLNMQSLTADVFYTLPNASGTLALQSWVSGSYLPTSGGTVTGDLEVQGANSSNTAALHVNSSTQGFMPPRMSSGERSTFESTLAPQDEGMIVYDRDEKMWYGWDGTAWQKFN